MEDKKVTVKDIYRLFDLIPKGSLYLQLNKEHLDPDNKLSYKEWEDFVDEVDSTEDFHEYCWEEGKRILEDWSSENLNKWKEQINEIEKMDDNH